MPNLEVSHDKVCTGRRKRWRAECCTWPRGSTKQVLIDEKSRTVDAHNNARVVAEHRRPRLRGGAHHQALRFPQSLEVLGLLLAETDLPSSLRRARLALICVVVLLHHGRQEGCSPVHLCAPGTGCSRRPEHKALVGAIALTDRPQALAEESPEDAVAGVLDDQNAWPDVSQLSIHRAERNAIYCHAVAKVPARPDLKQHWQAPHNARQQVTSSFWEDQRGALVYSRSRSLRALDHELRDLPAWHVMSWAQTRSQLLGILSIS
mmetsp:Transcript_12499/g.19794  ORF Transcript_12499/g.19794 Transcript_12499/m.19794 type:complete len:263 (-) Transcript_12499:13-801(-)